MLEADFDSALFNVQENPMSHKTPEQVAVDLPNEENEATVPYSAVVVGTPVPHDNPEEGDTAITITAKPGSGYKDKQTIYLTRLDLTELFQNAGIDTPELKTEAETIHGLIADLQEQFGMVVSTKEIQDGGIIFDMDGTAAIDLKASPTSMLYVGEVAMLLSPKVPGAIPLSSVFVNTVMSGLNYPLESVAHLTQPSYNRDVALSGPEVKNDNTLQHGLGWKNGYFTTVDNAELRLAAAVRSSNNDIIPDEDGHYSFNLGEDFGWSIPVSLRLEIPANHSGIRPLTDLYETYIQIESLNHANNLLLLKVVPSVAGYNLVSADGNLTITDSFSVRTEGNEEVLQNLITLVPGDTHFPAVPANGFGAAKGDFKVTVTSRRKNSLVPKLILTTAVSTTIA